MNKQTETKRWTEVEKEYLFENINKISFHIICEKLGRSQNAVNLFLHQHKEGKYTHIREENNMLIKALNIRFINYKWFSPDRKFYRLTGINQKRFNACLKGEQKLLNEELLKLNQVLCLSNDELLECRQLNLFK